MAVDEAFVVIDTNRGLVITIKAGDRRHGCQAELLGIEDA